MIENVNFPSIFAKQKCTSFIDSESEEGVSEQHEDENLSELEKKCVVSFNYHLSVTNSRHRESR